MQGFHFAGVTVGYAHLKPFLLCRRLWDREGISIFGGFRVYIIIIPFPYMS